MAKITRAEVLDTAKEYVTKDRAADHGDMEDNFKTIAIYWSVHLGVEVLPHDVGMMMMLLKAARAKSNSEARRQLCGCGRIRRLRRGVRHMMDEWIWTDPKRLACPECHGEGTLEETAS